ncbi:hypothetical protein FHW71_004657 [Enterobacter sp. Sphag1F]|jgi:hypothetical protein|nr:hypothetical protein [Enterobacter sp. Sphag1F]NYI16871.1 hypothetical protein [Enterobacter sp. Sphag71]
MMQRMKKCAVTMLMIFFSTFLATLVTIGIAETDILFNLIEKNIPYEVADKLTQSFWRARPEHAYSRIHTIICLFILFTTSGLIYSTLKTCIKRYRYKEIIRVKTFAFESLVIMIKPVYFFFLMYLYFYFLPQRIFDGYIDHALLGFLITSLFAVAIPIAIYSITKVFLKSHVLQKN